MPTSSPWPTRSSCGLTSVTSLTSTPTPVTPAYSAQATFSSHSSLTMAAMFQSDVFCSGYPTGYPICLDALPPDVYKADILHIFTELVFSQRVPSCPPYLKWKSMPHPLPQLLVFSPCDCHSSPIAPIAYTLTII